MAEEVESIIEPVESVEPDVTEDVLDGGFGLPHIKQVPKDKVLVKSLKEPIPVFIGKNRVLGFVKAMERYPTEDENGVQIAAPGNGETVYVCGFNLAGSKRLSGTYERKDLMIRQ